MSDRAKLSCVCSSPLCIATECISSMARVAIAVSVFASSKKNRICYLVLFGKRSGKYILIVYRLVYRWLVAGIRLGINTHSGTQYHDGNLEYCTLFNNYQVLIKKYKRISGIYFWEKNYCFVLLRKADGAGISKICRCRFGSIACELVILVPL